MSNSSIPHVDLPSALESVFNLGWTKSLRKSNTGVGKTLEDLLGISENNKSLPDFEYNGLMGELKARRYETNAELTLFTKEPIKGSLNDQSLVRKYGYIDEKGRPALKVDVWSGEYDQQGLALVVNRKAHSLLLQHKKDGTLWYWDSSTLKQKFENLLLAFAHSARDQNGNEWFCYDKATWATNLDLGKFLYSIEQKEIVVNLRIHLKSNGGPRNRGTAFRLTHDGVNSFLKYFGNQQVFVASKVYPKPSNLH